MSTYKQMLMSIYDMYRNGMGPADIAERYSLTEGIVLRLIKYQDVLEGTC